MPNWVKCRLRADETSIIYLNMEQLISIAPVRGGCDVTSVGSGKPLSLATTLFEILRESDIREV